MSFILDALRKSEAARRRNEAPDLFASMPDAPIARGDRSAWPLWIVGGIGVAALATSLWLALQRTSGDASTRDAAPAGPAIAPPLPSTPRAPTEAGAMPMPGPRPDAIPSIDPARVANAAPPASAPAPARPTPTEPPVASPPTPAARTDVAAEPTPAPAAPTMPVATVAAPTPSARNALRLSDLDPGTRKSLPPLKMSMHMWNEDGSRRFVILDGQRLGEGDMLGEVTVESITRDGVVLNWQGSRLRLDTR